MWVGMRRTDAGEIVRVPIIHCTATGVSTMKRIALKIPIQWRHIEGYIGAFGYNPSIGWWGSTLPIFGIGKFTLPSVHESAMSRLIKIAHDILCCCSPTEF